MTFHAYKDESRRVNWGCNDRAPNTDELKLGALLRIADATEVMAREYQRLINERDMYKRWYDDVEDERDRLGRSNSALRGQITRLRKRIVGE